MGNPIRRAVESDLPMHEPLRSSIYDEHNRLLLKQGFVITIPGFAQRLLQRGCYVRDSDDPAENSENPVDGKSQEVPASEKKYSRVNIYPDKPRDSVFLRSGELAISIRRIQKLLREVPSGRVVFQDFVRECANELLDLIEEDRDAVLAAAYLTNDVRDTRVNQQLLGAIVAVLIAPQCELSADKLLSLVCAALTRDVALQVFDKNYATVNKLSDSAMATVREHPIAAVKLLLQHGVNDRDWLTYVTEHHERPDGSGYPHGKKEGVIQPASLLLGLADAYAGMVLANPRRPGMFPANVMKEIYLGKGRCYRENHVVFLLKTLTRFPAGTLVSLVNGEIGVIRNPHPSQGQPQVYSLYNPEGLLRSSPIVRDSSLDEFKIAGCVAPEKCKSAELVIRRIWH